MRVQGMNELFGRDRSGWMLMKCQSYGHKHKEACDNTDQCSI